MAVIQTNKTEYFVKIPHSLVTDARLRPSSFRVLCYLLTKPKLWRVVYEDIANRLGVHRHTVAAAMKQLIEFGYARLKKKIVWWYQGKLFTGYHFDIFAFPQKFNVQKLDTSNKENTPSALAGGGGRSDGDLKNEEKEAKQFVELADKTLKGWREHYRLDLEDYCCEGLSLELYDWLPGVVSEFHERPWSEKYELLRQFYQEKSLPLSVEI